MPDTDNTYLLFNHISSGVCLYLNIRANSTATTKAYPANTNHALLHPATCGASLPKQRQINDQN